jgi:uncharacterized protein YdaL
MLQGMLIQLNLSEEEIRVLNYKRFREKSPILQKKLHTHLEETFRDKNISLIVSAQPLYHR